MKTNGVIITIVAMLASVSCQHKELCYDYPHEGSLEVVFDWSKVPETIDQNMELFLFPTNGGHPLHYQFYDIHGGLIEVPSDTYRAICVNSGTGANRFDGTASTFGEFRITSRAVKSEEDEILEPDILYSDRIVSGIDVISNTRQKVVMYPQQRTPRYTVIVKNVRNLYGARNCTASLSNLSCSYMAASDESLDDSHIETFNMARADEITLAGKITIFGHRHQECHNHILTLLFTLQDGKEVTFTADVSEQMNRLARERQMTGEIIVDLNIDIPKPISNGSGFQATVDGWEGEEIDISM